MENQSSNPYCSPRVCSERPTTRSPHPTVFRWRWVCFACLAQVAAASAIMAPVGMTGGFKDAATGTPNFLPLIWLLQATLGPVISAVVLGFLGFICREEEQVCFIPLGTATLASAIPLMLFMGMALHHTPDLLVRPLDLLRFLAVVQILTGPFLAAGMAFDLQLWKVRHPGKASTL